MASNLSQRVMIGAGLAIGAIVALAVGGVLLWAVAAVAAVGMLIEWAGLIATPRLRTATAVAALVVAMVLALPMVWGADRSTVAAVAGLALFVAALGGHVGLAAGLIYAGFPTVALLYLRVMPHGFALALWALAIVWATDIGAYFAGRAIGGAKLAPKLSPNKTWAGLGGGVLAAAIVGAAIALAAGLAGGFLWLGASLAILAQAGDLFESWLKRRAGAKDSGVTLGAHGGLLDRLDGAVPVLVLVGALVANGNLVP